MKRMIFLFITVISGCEKINESAPQYNDYACYKKTESENSQSQYYLGLFYEKGIVLEKNSDKAHKYYLLSAESGNPTAQNRLGKWASPSINRKESLKWHTLAAKQGISESLLAAGMLNEGDRNYTEAYKYYLLAKRFNNFDKDSLLYNLQFTNKMIESSEKNLTPSEREIISTEAAEWTPDYSYVTGKFKSETLEIINCLKSTAP